MLLSKLRNFIPQWMLSLNLIRVIDHNASKNQGNVWKFHLFYDIILKLCLVYTKVSHNFSELYVFAILWCSASNLLKFADHLLIKGGDERQSGWVRYVQGIQPYVSACPTFIDIQNLLTIKIINWSCFGINEVLDVKPLVPLFSTSMPIV